MSAACDREPSTESSDFREELSPLWERTRGSSDVCIAVLDGPVDLAHPCFRGADLSVVESRRGAERWRRGSVGGVADHGTLVASLLFGQPGSPVLGVAPRCRGLVIPVMRSRSDGSIASCSQLDLARAIVEAAARGAAVISISAGQLEVSGEPEFELARAVQSCLDAGVLIVAAAGNDGCECWRVPAAQPGVLVVGALDEQGRPWKLNNWSERYRQRGILAPGEHIRGALAGGRVGTASGTSMATPIVAGVAGLLMSCPTRRGVRRDGRQVRDAMLRAAKSVGAAGSEPSWGAWAGRLDVLGAMRELQLGVCENMSILTNLSHPTAHALAPAFAPLGTPPASSPIAPGPNSSAPNALGPTSFGATQRGAVEPAACQCSGGETPTATRDSHGSSRREEPAPTLVYAIGQLDIDFQTEANRDAFRQLGVAVPDDRQAMYDFLTAVSPRSAAALSRIASLGAEPLAGAFGNNAEYEAAVRRWRSQVGVQLTSLANPLPHMAYAEGLTWVMTQDSTPVYAILAGGAYGAQTLSLLVDFLGDQLRGDSEYIALPGHIVGSTQLLTGYEVPVVVPDLRGLANWRRADLISAALSELGFNPVTDDQRREVEDEISNLLGRIYHELRNLGILPQDRALNFSATNVFQFATAYARDIRKELFRLEWKLDKVAIERSTVCRPGSDCWDIKLIFFEPAKRLESTRRVHRFTVDVSQVIPVTVGPVRSWYIN